MTTPASRSDTMPPAGFRVVELSREPVELYKMLKLEGLAASGGQAKAAVTAGQVLANGEVETQNPAIACDEFAAYLILMT